MRSPGYPHCRKNGGYSEAGLRGNGTLEAGAQPKGLLFGYVAVFVKWSTKEWK